MSEMILSVYFFAVSFLPGYFTTWKRWFAALVAGIGYCGLAVLLVATGVLRLEEPTRVSVCTVIAGFWAMVAIGRWAQHRAIGRRRLT